MNVINWEGQGAAVLAAASSPHVNLRSLDRFAEQLALITDRCLMMP